jgi:hypothetical protein
MLLICQGKEEANNLSLTEQAGPVFPGVFALDAIASEGRATR